VIFALAILARSLWIAYAGHGPGHDGFSYWGIAQSVASGKGYSNPFAESGPTAFFPPLWPLILAALIKLFDPDLLAAQSFLIVVGSVSAVLAYLVGARVLDRRAGVVAGILVALFPSQVYFTSVMMTETLFVMQSVLFVLLIILWFAESESHKLWHAVVLGLLLGAMALTRAEALFLVPLLLVLFKLLGLPWFLLGQVIVAIVVGMTVLIIPWTVRNYIQVDELVLIRKPGHGEEHVLRVGLSPNYEEASNISTEEPLTWREIGERYSTQPWLLATLASDKLKDLYGSDDQFRWIVTALPFEAGTLPVFDEDEESRWAALANGYYYVVGVLAVVGLPFWFSRRNKPLLVVLWFVAAWSLIHLAFAPTVRMHFPVIPMIAIISGGSAIALWDRFAAPSLAERRSAAPSAPLPTSEPAD